MTKKVIRKKEEVEKTAEQTIAVFKQEKKGV